MPPSIRLAASAGETPQTFCYSLRGDAYYVSETDPDGSTRDTFFADKGDALTWFRLRFNWLAVTYVDPDLQDFYEGYNDLRHVPVRLKQAWVERARAGAQLPGGQVRIGDSPLGRPA
jgi:hypothetical protein